MRWRPLLLAGVAGALGAAAACNSVKLSSPYDPPDRLWATAVPGGVVFRWSAAPGATAYLVYVSTTSPDPTTANPTPLPATTQSLRIAGNPAQPIHFAVATKHDDPGGTSFELSAPSAAIAGVALPPGFFSSTGTPLPTLGGGTLFGMDVAAAGDVDGDGIGDVVVGAPGASTGVGAVSIISGASQTVILGIPGSTANGRLGEPLAGPGDAQGDGTDDVFFGGPGTGKVLVAYDARVGQQQGFVGTPQFDLSSLVADVNQDGIADLLIGRPSDGGGAGSVELRLGTTNGLPPNADTTVTSTSHPIGHALGVGDFDGDGKPDLLVGAWGGGPQKEGEICFGGNLLAGTPPLHCTLGIQTNGFLGDSIAVLGDVSHDGRDDAIVVDYPDSGLRTAQLWLGTGGTVGVHRSTWSWPMAHDGLTANSNPMHHLAAAPGDLDGDGIPDAIVADPGRNEVLVFLGTTAGSLTAAPVETVLDPGPSSGTGGTDEFGVSIAYGNTDGDRQPDLIVGSPGADLAYVFPGLPTRGPTVDAGPAVTVAPGGNLNFDPLVQDPVGATGAPTCSVEWGDGAGSQTFVCAAGTSHVFGRAGVFHPTVTMTTADGRVGASSTTVRVR